MTRQLVDNHGRRVDYLRLSVTDRCNLRCRYCMPSEGIPLTHKSDLLTWEQMLRLSRLLTDLGIRKIRITGGEPFVRRGLLQFLAALHRLPSRPFVAVTSNGSLLQPHLEELQAQGVTHLNISLDSLRPEGYRAITRRDDFDRVWRALDRATELGFRLKLNVVVVPELNRDEIPDFVELTRERDLTVRFIEPMPFGGQQARDLAPLSVIDSQEILRLITTQFSLQRMVNTQSAVDDLYQVEGYRGRVGIIPGHTRSFCGSCSRLRLAVSGQLRTCLYGRPTLNLRRLLLEGASDEQIAAAVIAAVQQRHADGWIAARESSGSGSDRRPGNESMAAIGG